MLYKLRLEREKLYHLSIPVFILSTIMTFESSVL